MRRGKHAKPKFADKYMIALYITKVKALFLKMFLISNCQPWKNE